MHEQWLRRLLRHMIYNAILSTSSDGEHMHVTIRTAIQDAFAEVQVEDSGYGITSNIESMLFKQPVPHADGRLGRGLLLVRFIVEQHGGEAILVWNRPGEGACFAFRVPMSQVGGSFDKESEN